MADASLCFSMSHSNISDYRVDLHTHDCYELVYYIDGTGVSKVEDTEYPYSDHTFCLIPPQIRHCDWTTSTVNLMYIGFNYNDRLGTPLPRGLLVDEDRSVYRLTAKIQKELKTRNLYYQDLLTALLEELIITVLRRSNAASDTEKDILRSMQYVTNFIHSNIGASISLEDLAQSIGYSYHYFRHIFKSIYGVSPKQYILEARITQAKLLLQQEDLSVKTIAQNCGFGNASQFSAAFRQHTGKSPLEYKRSALRFEERAKYDNV